MMRGSAWCVVFVILSAAPAVGQEGPGGDQTSPRPQNYQNMTPEQRAAATREFLGLGAKPDRAAAARGAPVFKQNCAFCHGPLARGATGPSLITSEIVLGDDHGEHLAPYVKKGRPDKGMPSFETMQDPQLKDIAEFLHLQVEEVANRGAYRVLNILVGDKAKGRAYVEAHCSTCHAAGSFAHIGSRFRSPEQLQRGWIWPSRRDDPKLAVTATVKTPDGSTIAGRVTEVSDFRIVVVDAAGARQAVERTPGVAVEIKDPLEAHEPMIMTLSNDDMHNVTAWLASLK
jgi:cytochrome c oxidase cbb3-type subunit III